MIRAAQGAVWLAAGTAAALITACGAPTAHVVQAGESSISFEVPSDYTELSQDDEGQAIYGLPGSSPVDLGSDPVLFMLTGSNGEQLSFRRLRTIATGGKFDPMDPKLEVLPDKTHLIEYEEILESNVWGIRMVLVVGNGAKDFQVLVDRASDQVVVTELTCTQACFVEQRDLIEEIQGSWSLEP